MIIEFRCEHQYARRWMDRRSLAVDGRDVPVQVAWTSTVESRPAGLEGLFELERMILRRGKPGGADRLAALAQQSQSRIGEADIVIDFTGGSRDRVCPARLYLRPLFNGVAGENAALSANLPSDLPVLELVNEIDGTVLVSSHA